MVSVCLAKSWASLTISCLLDIKAALSIIVSPSSSYLISPLVIQTNTNLSRLTFHSSVTATLTFVLSLAQTHPYQRHQTHGYVLRPQAPSTQCRGGCLIRSTQPVIRTSPVRYSGPVLQALPAHHTIARQTVSLFLIFLFQSSQLTSDGIWCDF
ncbi:hypothetical protein KEM48_014479 [Puccinia striiformis f. sp. tritici PST-130]|nr:hypothetical protein KEM48_014479 [Puccinia striiformis f. sp. tritici PST-130]